MTVLLETLIAEHARTNNLPRALVAAIVQVESGGLAWAYKPEPRYHYLWNVRTAAPFRALTLPEIASEMAPADFPFLAGSREQEWWAQQASWGLMQIMGAAAREEGFTGLYLPELCDPIVGLRLGCKHLGALLRWANGDTWKASAAYNAGRGGWASPAGGVYALKVHDAMPAFGGNERTS
jgi:hypothetical protein